jgi:hypothetical protein
MIIVGASSGRGFCGRFPASTISGGKISARVTANVIQAAMTSSGHRTTTSPMRSKIPPGLAASPAPVRLDTQPTLQSSAYSRGIITNLAVAVMRP